VRSSGLKVLMGPKMLDTGHTAHIQTNFDQKEDGFTVLIRWCGVAIILAHLFAGRFGGLVTQSVHPTIIAIYLFILFLAFGLPALEKTGRGRLIELSKLVTASLPVFYVYYRPTLLIGEFPYLNPLTSFDWILATIAMVGIVLASLPLARGFLSTAFAPPGEPVQVGGQRALVGRLGALLRWFAVAVILYHLVAAAVGAPEVMKFRPTHVAMYVSMIFLVYGITKDRQTDHIPWYDWALFMLSWIPVLYIYGNYNYVVERYPYITDLTPIDWVVAIIAITLAMESCRRAIGITLVALLAIFLVHGLFGPYFPGPLNQAAVSPMRFVDHLFLTTQGLYGSITGISATYVLMFVLLGAVLEQARGGDLFMNLAAGLMGKQPGGPGKAAVLASGLFGSISGAAVANVYATGTFTIPLMIKTGFKPRFAAAVEAVASASGQLVPPIMGSAAFLIADFTGTPYIEVAKAAALPAFLYLFAVYFMVHLETKKFGLPSMELDLVRKARREVRLDIHMMLVLVIVVILLVDRTTPFYAAFAGVICTVLVSFLRSRTQLTLHGVLYAFEVGARRIAPIAAALFIAALVVGTIELSGLGLRFTSILINITGGNLLLTLLLVMVSCIILGMGLPTSAAYMIVAIFGAPALIKLGIEPLAAHFFVFYYAIISAITPPVAVAAYAAATIAGTPLQKTGLTAMKLGAAVYLVPFVMVYSPALLSVGGVGEIIQAFVTGVVGVVALATAVQGFLIISLTIPERVLAALAAASLLHGDWRTDTVGAAILALIVITQMYRSKHDRSVG